MANSSLFLMKRIKLSLRISMNGSLALLFPFVGNVGLMLLQFSLPTLLSSDDICAQDPSIFIITCKISMSIMKLVDGEFIIVIALNEQLHTLPMYSLPSVT